MLDPKEQLLRDFLNETLKEYDGGDDYGGGGGHGVSDDFIKGIFDAFVDPLRHTAAFVERFSSEVQKFAGKLSEDLLTISIPGYKANYSKFERAHNERLNSIQDKYKEVFARTEANLFTGDAALMAFLFSPYKYTTGRILKTVHQSA